MALSVVLLAGYWGHARRLTFPLLQLKLFTIRTFRAAVSGSLFTRLGIGGVPFLLPLLYQVGLGLTPIQSSGLLVMPQAIAAMNMMHLNLFQPQTLGGLLHSLLRVDLFFLALLFAITMSLRRARTPAPYSGRSRTPSSSNFIADEAWMAEARLAQTFGDSEDRGSVEAHLKLKRRRKRWPPFCTFRDA